MAFVLDASVAACWAFPDENQPVSDEALRRLADEAAHVPALWWFEVQNTLLMGERRQRITPDATRRFLRLVDSLGLDTDRSPDGGTIMDLARRHRLTAYDAAYLELARRQGVALATLDGALARAAHAEGVGLLGAVPQT